MQRVTDNIKRLGHNLFFLKSDQERALLDLVKGVIEQRDEPTDPESAPVHESQSNGVTERGVRAVKDQVRTRKLALEKRLECKVHRSSLPD